jgi:hypothetical protein
MESSASAAAEKDGRIRVTARKPATTPPASKRLRNVDAKMCAANDDMRTFLRVTRNARSQASGTDHELALSLVWRPATSLGAGASAAPVRRTLRRSISLSLAAGWSTISPSMAHWSHAPGSLKIEAWLWPPVKETGPRRCRSATGPIQRLLVANNVLVIATLPPYGRRLLRQGGFETRPYRPSMFPSGAAAGRLPPHRGRWQSRRSAAARRVRV